MKRDPGPSVLSKYLTLSFAFRTAAVPQLEEGGNIFWRSEVEKTTASERARAWVGFLPEIVAPNECQGSFFLPDFIPNPELY